MADKHLHVYMDGERAGTVTMTGAGALTFAYDDEYRTTPDAVPLSLSMPKARARHKNSALLPFLQGLLPDNDQALEAVAATYQVSAASPFAILQHTGHDVAGALQFVAPGSESEDAVADRTVVEPISDDEVAADLRSIMGAYRNGDPVPTSGALRHPRSTRARPAGRARRAGRAPRRRHDHRQSALDLAPLPPGRGDHAHRRPMARAGLPCRTERRQRLTTRRQDHDPQHGRLVETRGQSRAGNRTPRLNSTNVRL